ncbi:ArsR family transcriptional regulator [Natrialba swarupiae]|nr:ArsR family transcriptional regulator [Natrialba swarupiae]
MRIDENSRDIIYVLEREDGTATTTDIRRHTGLSNSAVRYRFGKLEDLGLVETEHDPDATPEGVAPLTVASLTDLAREEIQTGLTAESEQRRAPSNPQTTMSESRSSKTK